MQLPFQGHEAKNVTEHNGLIYVAPETKGYKRIKKNGKFIYLDLRDNIISTPKILKRIEGLVIPPAWQEVWICPSEKGHLQVTGIDTKGRKQYRYHPKWQAVRNETKFDRLYYFGKKLNKLRRQIKKDLRRKYPDKAKITALALSIMEATLIRVGNTAYEKEYGSLGLTTLKNRNVRFKDGSALFKFKGKKGVEQLVALKEKTLIRLLKKVKELPGQELFQYRDSERVLHALDSSDINDYLKQHMDEAFTCKDFRSWAGCVAAIEVMLDMQQETDGETNLKSKLPLVIDQVAERLGNTRAVCQKYYIHPRLLKHFEEGTLSAALPVADIKKGMQGTVEKALLFFLRNELKAIAKRKRENKQ